MPDLEHTTIGRYQIEDYLAKGGMSEIYLARDSVTQCTVAMKLVHNSNSDYYTRFRHETATLTSLAHDHILPAFDYGEYNSWYYLVTPYISYGTLHRRLLRGQVPLTLRHAGMILEQLAGALQHAHDCGIVHRDIKPSNVLMRDGEHVYLADFGLAQKIGESDTGEEGSSTEGGYLIGTPEYMAPELAEHEATPASDIYSLGILLYQMLTGRVPFSGSTPIGTYLKHLRERPLPPSALNPAIPDAIEAVVMRALQRLPQRRFPSARAFADAYREALQEIPYYEERTSLSALSTRTTAHIVISRHKITEASRPYPVVISPSLKKSDIQRTDKSVYNYPDRSLRRRSIAGHVQMTAVMLAAAVSLVFLPLVLGYAVGQSHMSMMRTHNPYIMSVNLLPDALSPALTTATAPPPITSPTPSAVNGGLKTFHSHRDTDKHSSKHKHKHKDDDEEGDRH